MNTIKSREARIQKYCQQYTEVIRHDDSKTGIFSSAVQQSFIPSLMYKHKELGLIKAIMEELEALGREFGNGHLASYLPLKTAKHNFKQELNLDPDDQVCSYARTDHEQISKYLQAAYY